MKQINIIQKTKKRSRINRMYRVHRQDTLIASFEEILTLVKKNVDY